MNEVNKTLYIPLYGKAVVSKRGIILRDPKAEEIWAAEGFPLKGKAASKWLAYYMGIRSAVFDRWLREKMEGNPGAAVLHIGCGMDSRIARVGSRGSAWYDVDFPEVIAQRKLHFEETAEYHMLAADARQTGWLDALPDGDAIVVMEGISMYMEPAQLQNLLAALAGHFERVSVLMDCYTELAARASKYKNPVNDVGVTTLYGIDDPKTLETGDIKFLREHTMTPGDLIGQLRGMEKAIFRTLFAGSFAKKLYRLYEFSAR